MNITKTVNTKTTSTGTINTKTTSSKMANTKNDQHQNHHQKQQYDSNMMDSVCLLEYNVASSK